MTGVPTIYARMLPHLTPGERFPSLRFLRCGSAPITPTLHQQIEEAFGVPLVVSYGLSEATCTSTMNPPDGRRIGTIGTVLAGQDVRLFDPVTNTEVAQGGEGEIRIGGPALMAGYLGSAEQPIVDGWLRTGDLGRFDEDGFLTITGRIKDVIIRGGENISPALIERHLATHPTVRDCCVVGAPDADLGEVPVAFVVLEGRRGTRRARPEGVRERLARSHLRACRDPPPRRAANERRGQNGPEGSAECLGSGSARLSLSQPSRPCALKLPPWNVVVPAFFNAGHADPRLGCRGR